MVLGIFVIVVVVVVEFVKEIEEFKVKLLFSEVEIVEFEV